MLHLLSFAGCDLSHDGIPSWMSLMSGRRQGGCTFTDPSRCGDQPSYCPTKDDVDNDVILYLCCLPDGDVGLDHLDVHIRCLGCAHIFNDECVTAGSETLIYDDVEVAKGA